MNLPDSSQDDLEQLRKLVNKATERFLVAPPDDQIQAQFSQRIGNAPQPFCDIGKAFETNITSLLTTTSIPHRLAHAAAHDRNWQRYLIAERIRSLKTPKPNGPTNSEGEVKELAREAAEKKYRAFIESEAGTNQLIKDALALLLDLLDDSRVSIAVDEMVRQGVVLCWGAFEVAARDCFTALLNENPGLIEALLHDSTAKRRFELSKIPLELLTAHDFNVSKKMGTILSQQQDMSDLKTIKAVYEALFPQDTELLKELNGDELRKLNLDRNLIVHRRATIDDQYRRASKCAQDCGELLSINPDRLERYVEVAIKTATLLLHAALDTVKRS